MMGPTMIGGRLTTRHLPQYTDGRCNSSHFSKPSRHFVNSLHGARCYGLSGAPPSEADGVCTASQLIFRICSPARRIHNCALCPVNVMSDTSVFSCLLRRTWASACSIRRHPLKKATKNIGGKSWCILVTKICCKNLFHVFRQILL